MSLTIYISIYIKLSLYFSQDSILYSSKHKKLLLLYEP
nr:MAG TPA: hypothetical protein [Bacteriophage sp.]